MARATLNTALVIIQLGTHESFVTCMHKVIVFILY